jgi:hypothetical protein
MNLLKTFKELFIKEQYKNGTYVAAKFSPKSCTALVELQNKLKIQPTPLAEFHVTIMHSRKPFDYPEYQEIYSEVQTKEFHIFEGTHRALVLLLDSKYLEKLHQDMMKQYDATYDFDKYVPHVTLCYNYKGDVPKFIPNLNLELTSIFSEELDLTL